MSARVLLTRLPCADEPRDCQSKHGCDQMASHSVLVEEGAARTFKFLCEKHTGEVAEMYKIGVLTIHGQGTPPPEQAPADPFAPPAKPKRPPILFEIPDGAQPVPCRSCADSVVWVLTRNMKRMPVNAFGPHRGESHFSTCPQANQHRKPR